VALAGAALRPAGFALVVFATFLDFLALFAPTAFGSFFAFRVIALVEMLPCIMSCL
jgi:hypothetical protein